VSTLKASIDINGNLTLTGATNPTRVNAVNDTAGSVVIQGKGAASQTADMLLLKDSSNSTLFRVQASGAVASTYFATASGGGSYINVGASSNVANLTLFSGTPAFEMYANKGGASTTFNDFMYLHHQAADTTAVLRRFGMLMRVGDEVPGDASKTAALYLESSAASFGNPNLILAAGDAVVLTVPSSGAAVFSRPVTSTGIVKSNIASGSFSYDIGGQGSIGVQGSSVYVRASTTGIYFYGGGAHSDSPGNANGGVLMASLVGGDTVFTVNQVRVSNSTGLGTSNPPLSVGQLASTNVQLNQSSVQAYNNSVASTLNINTVGGVVNLGKSGVNTNLLGTVVLSSALQGPAKAFDPSLFGVFRGTLVSGVGNTVTSSDTNLNWQTSVWDPFSQWDGSQNITLNASGIWLVFCSVTMNASGSFGSGLRRITINQNGSGRTGTTTGSAGAFVCRLSCAIVVKANSGDNISVAAVVDSTTGSLGMSTPSYFAAVFLGPAS
jgi:hypothetical protein